MSFEESISGLSSLGCFSKEMYRFLGVVEFSIDLLGVADVISRVQKLFKTI